MPNGLKQVEAFILVETKAGTAMEVAERLKKAEGIKDVFVVTGPYDLIVRAAAGDLKSLASTVVDEIGAIAGVSRTLSCIVVEAVTGSQAHQQ